MLFQAIGFMDIHDIEEGTFLPTVQSITFELRDPNGAVFSHLNPIIPPEQGMEELCQEVAAFVADGILPALQEASSFLSLRVHYQHLIAALLIAPLSEGFGMASAR